MPPPPPQPPLQPEKSEALHSQARQVITNVLNYFELEKKRSDYNPGNAVIRASFATGYSISTIRRVLSERMRGKVRPAGISNNKNKGIKKHKGIRNKVCLTDLDYCTLRNVIQNFLVRRETPSLKQIFNAARKQIIFNKTNVLSSDALRKIMKTKLGFNYKKLKSGQQILIERHGMKIMRTKYLSRLRMNDALGASKKPVVYLDATWIDPVYGAETYDKKTKEFANKLKPWILIHAGGEMGFIDNAKLLHKCSNCQITVYQNEMDKDTFIRWLTYKLLPSLPKRALIILDNGPYFNTLKEKTPNAHSTRSDMIRWLRKREIQHDDHMFKSELYELIKNNKHKKVYIVNSVLEAAGHEVLRIPMYNSDLNPVRHIWDTLKRRLADVCERQQLAQLTETVIFEVMASITREDWIKQCQYVKRLEIEYWQRELILEEQTESLLEFSDEENDKFDDSSDEHDAVYDFNKAYALSQSCRSDNDSSKNGDIIDDNIDDNVSNDMGMSDIENSDIEHRADIDVCFLP